VNESDLLALVARGRRALAAHPFERVHEALTVLPDLVNALDDMARFHVELSGIRKELTMAVGKLREEVRIAQQKHPEVTYRSAHVQAAMRHVTAILDRLDNLLSEAGGHG